MIYAEAWGWVGWNLPESMDVFQVLLLRNELNEISPMMYDTGIVLA